MCHHLDPSYFRGQSHTAYIIIILNPCFGHNFLLSCRIWIFHTIVVHDPRVCHSFDPRSYLQDTHSENQPLGHTFSMVTCIWMKFVRAITHYYFVIFEKYVTELLSIAQGCILTLTYGHISKKKVTMYT